MTENIIKPLKDEVDELFEFALNRTATTAELKSFHQLLERSQQRLHEPMRVAIVGLIKAGKSTIINSLLGQSIVATGSVEATFNINWLKYGDTSRLVVHFKNDRQPPEEKSFAELTALTLRPEQHQDYLLSIKYIEAFHDNELLKTINIIDTPGLNSTYEDDSDNTKQFLSIHGKKLTEITKEQVTNADAVMYLFSHSLGQLDANLLEQLQQSLVGNATPINAIGVLTKVDFYSSDPNVTDPLATAIDVAQELQKNPLVRRLFYTIKPVCGLLSIGVKTLTDEHWQILIALAQLPLDRFQAISRNANKFIKPYEDISIPHHQREKILSQLGQYGITLAYDYLNAGVSNRAELTAKLLKHTGITELQQLILAHFGNRSILIKLDIIFQQIATFYFQERQCLTGSSLAILEEISGKFENLRSRQHAFQELDILRSYYDRKLNFDSTEVEQLLQITGEYGKSCGERLGMVEGENASVDKMLPIALERVRYWQARADDYMVSDRATVKAATVLARSYERILYRVQKAKEYLYI